MADVNEETLKVLQKMSDVLEGMKSKEEMHEKAPAQFMTAQRLHGFNGTFATPGIERDVISAHMRPEGIGDTLPLLPTTDENPYFASLTGVGEYAGAEPTYVCDDAPSGYIKGALLTSRFGRVRRDTDTIDITQVMRRVNRGEMTDLVLRGQLLGLSGLTPSGVDQGQVLNVVTMSEMVTAAIQAERKLIKMMWQGNFSIPGEFPGLDAQIATGQKDAETMTLVPSLDSYVRNFGGQLVTSAATLVEEVSTMEWYLRNNARKTGLDPVEWVFVMRPDMYQEITAVWPIAYNTSRGNVMSSAYNVNITLDGRTNVQERDAMRAGRYLDVNGTRYRVILDDGIFEKNNTNTLNVPAGTYQSSIYMVPLTIAGGMPVCYRQYFDYRVTQPDVALFNGTEQFFWTDNGLFSWAVSQIKWCYKLSLLTEQRVVLRTPQLAGRLDNVRYTPLVHLRDTDPASSYFVDGGVSVRGMVQAPYAVWSAR